MCIRDSGSVPTQSAWEDVEVISGDADKFNEWIAEYCRTTHKNGYDIPVSYTHLS